MFKMWVRDVSVLVEVVGLCGVVDHRGVGVGRSTDVGGV